MAIVYDREPHGVLVDGFDPGGAGARQSEGALPVLGDNIVVDGPRSGRALAGGAVDLEAVAECSVGAYRPADFDVAAELDVTGDPFADHVAERDLGSLGPDLQRCTGASAGGECG